MDCIVYRNVTGQYEAKFTSNVWTLSFMIVKSAATDVDGSNIISDLASQKLNLASVLQQQEWTYIPF